jgi:CHAT domain-containing protein/pimeloyl-ACP methyl ester carboxylesterase
LDVLARRGAATRSGFDTLSGIVKRVFTLAVGGSADAIIQEAKQKAIEWAREKGGEELVKYVEGGVSRLGTKALLWAVERRLDRQSGLYRFRGAHANALDLETVGAVDLAKDAAAGPLLLFVHGTASSTAGSFSDLTLSTSDLFRKLEARFGERIYAFEHRTLSESPIENAIELVSALPKGARVSLVTHSRGGLIGDLLCIRNFDDLVASFGTKLLKRGPDRGGDRVGERDERPDVYSDQRADLIRLSALLKEKQLSIDRYVRVACPARGTRLASGNFDAFLSGLLSVIGLVPVLAASPIYAAFKRVVLEIAKNRTRPELVPGLEAMLPESPLAAFLRRAQPQAGLTMSVIAGDIEGGGLLKRLGVFFTDMVFFDRVDNDLIVDTDSMYAGVAPAAGSRVLFERGPHVSHFRYFSNERSRQGLVSWLTAASVNGLENFADLPSALHEPDAAEVAERKTRAALRGATALALPVAVILPGIMGSHLWVNRNRIWFDLKDIAFGGLKKVSWTTQGVEAEALFEHFYGGLCEHLELTHTIERFAYDWRQPLDVLADRLNATLEPLLARTEATNAPIRLLAHSMGGLVVRALCHKHPETYRKLMSRDGARFVMLGTPNHGSHSMVESLIGKSSLVRMLARADLELDLQEILDVIAAFRGALQLLPRPGFQDSGDQQAGDYYELNTWLKLREGLQDPWFGNRICAKPSSDALERGRWLWDQDETNVKGTNAFGDFVKKTIYVYGSSPSTPAGIKMVGDSWKMLSSTRGDSAVTWNSGTLAGVEQRFFMPVEHGALANTRRYFGALTDLLASGSTTGLPTTSWTQRDANSTVATRDTPVAYDAGPPLFPTPADLCGGLFGQSGNPPAQLRELPALRVRVRAMDLRRVDQAVLIGHYAEDPISGAEALIDREILGGELSLRMNLGLYAGAVGTATVVLRQNGLEQQRGTASGAVVTGLGTYDGSLSSTTLRDAVRAGVLRYLLHVKDCRIVFAGDGARAQLTSVLLGYNSSANISIADSVTTIVRGVVEANKKFDETTSSPLRVTELDIVEVYLDTAISALHALNQVVPSLNDDPSIDCRIEVVPRLDQGPGMRPRLDNTQGAGYWPRMIVSDYDRNDEDCPPECFDDRCPPEDPCECEEERPGSQKPEGSPKPPPKKLPAWLRRRLAPADRLRFLHVGARARAESMVQQRQPGLIERLVETQIRQSRYDADFSRTLFQLLVPGDLKDTVRQMKQMVLVLDRYTADLPWELMLADDQPLAVRTAVVRQLKSGRFRARVRQAPGQGALVVGNPSTVGFVDIFPSVVRRGDDGALPELPGAEAEAQGVAQSLFAQGFEVTRLLGVDTRALTVLATLYKAPYRILHIAAHGVFELADRDGKPRSGICLSDGILITAAEIQAMEIVPELVFLNCCHAGRVAGTAFNRLAHSISRELIEIGVRAVVVAGWAVDDQAALAFARNFYREFLENNRSFGHAVFGARQYVYGKFPNSMTWGAYQAYCGDPGWVFDLKREVRSDGNSGDASPQRRPPVAPEELVDQLNQIRLSISRRRGISKRDARDIAANVDSELVLADKNRADVNDSYGERVEVLFALANLFAELGPDYLRQARTYYERVLKARGAKGLAPLNAVEQLAHAEIAYAFREPEAPELGTKPDAADAKIGDDFRERIALVNQAIERFSTLDTLVETKKSDLVETKKSDDTAASEKADTVDPRRATLLASAYKRLAAVHARHLSSRADSAKDSEPKEMRDALATSSRHYRKAFQATAQGTELDPYPLLNWLFLELLQQSAQRASDFTDRARACSEAALTRYSRDPSFWNTVVVAELMLFDKLRAAPGAREQKGFEPGGDDPAQTLGVTLDEIAQRYREALDSSSVSPRDLESVLGQIRCLRDCYEAEATVLGLPSRRELAESQTGSGPAADAPQPQKWREAASPTRSPIAIHLHDLLKRLEPGSEPS